MERTCCHVLNNFFLLIWYRFRRPVFDRLAMGIKGMHKFKKKFWKRKLFQSITCPEGFYLILLFNLCPHSVTEVLYFVHTPGGVAYIDAFCWLHQIGCKMGRTLYQSPEIGRRMVVEDFLALVELVRSSGGEHHWCAHPVFDGAPSPAKANEDARRRAARRQHLNEATRLEGMKRGTTTEAHKHYNAWWRPSPLLVHEICVVLSSRCVPFTVSLSP